MANLFLVVLVVLTFAFCLLLYSGMVSTRESLDLLDRSHLVPPAVLAELSERYQWKQTLDMVLIVMSASMGVALFIIYRYLVRVSTTLREVRTVERDVLNSITRGIVTVDLRANITSCNRALEEIVGAQAAAVIRRPMKELFAQEDPLYRLLKDSIQEGARPQESDLEYTSKTGRILALRVTTFPLKDEFGERVGGILLVKDMTEMRKMEERIQRASRLAALGQLTQRLVHEIRNPVSAMDINLQLLQERLELRGGDPEFDRYVGIMSTEIRRLDEVLHNAQLFAQPQPPTLETVDLHQIIRQIIYLLQEEAARNGVEITEDLQAEAHLVRADADQLKQVFINLFKNSFEAMPEGGKLEVISRNGSDGKVIGVELVDSGRGIPMADLQRIFDPYFTTKKKGTGLGLSIVHNIVTQHGGSIDVSSWLGEGTIFSIVLPLEQGVAEEHGDAKAENPHRGR
ncbi:MAG: two-component system sensor histidine kinase NtrB [Syntrophobacteria bacterium]